jgi:hypothetical protein
MFFIFSHSYFIFCVFAFISLIIFNICSVFSSSEEKDDDENDIKDLLSEKTVEKKNKIKENFKYLITKFNPLKKMKLYLII